MTARTISIDATGAVITLYRTVLASLPNSYRIVDTDAEVVVVSASDPARIQQVCSGETRAVVIDRPGRLSSHELAAIAAAAGRHDCIVVPAVLYGPRADAAADLLDTARVDLLESTIISRHASLVAGRTVGLAAHSARLGRVRPHPARFGVALRGWRRRWPITRSRMYF